MEITFFGLCWILLLFYLFFYGNIFEVISITMISMLMQGTSVLTFGETSIGPQVLTSCFFCLYYLLVIQNYSRSKIKYWLPCLVYYAYIIYMIMMLPANSNILVLFQITIYVSCGYLLCMCRKYVEKSKYISLCEFILIFFLVIGVFQFLCSSLILPKEPLRILLLNKAGENAQFTRFDFYPRLFSTFQEPSYCSTFIVASFFFVLHLRKLFKFYRILLPFLFFELVLTFSSTGYVSFAVMFLVYGVLFGNRRSLKIIIPIIIMLLLFVWLFKDSIMQDVVFGKLEGKSAGSRLLWDQNALEAFYSRPLTGTGFGSSRASSFVIGILGETGIIGASFYVLFSITLYASLIVKRQSYTSIEIASRLFALSVFLGMSIACPDQTLCTFWLGFYLIMLSPDKIVTIIKRKDDKYPLLNWNISKFRGYRKGNDCTC